MKWDRGWHGQANRWIDVDEAIELRDLGTLKTGDLFCCPCENTRLSPVDSVVRVKHLRKHSKHRKEPKRVLCNKIRKAREKGESWKYSRVVDAIVHYLETDAKDALNIESVVSGESKDDPDIIVTHSETIRGFDSEKSYIIVPFQNLRRSRELFNRYAPNSVAVEIHRWRDGDVDFIKYIRERVDKAYEIGSGGSLSPEFLHSSTNIPNMGVWRGQSGGLGRGLTLKVDADVDVDSDEYEVLSDIERMIDVVEEHNLWAISTPRMHRYHLRNLEFVDFTTQGSHHPDPSIDAMISWFDPSQQVSTTTAPKNGGDWYIRATHGDEAALQEGVKIIEEQFNQVKESIIQERVETGWDSDEAREFADKALATQPSAEERVRSQIEFERRTIESRNEFMKEFARNLRESHGEKIRTLYRDGKATIESGCITVITELGEVVLTDIDSLFYRALLAEAPKIQFWDQIEEKEKKSLMTTARRFYRKSTFFRGTALRIDLLTDFGVDEVPKILTDTNGIANAIENLPDSDEAEFTPISKGDLSRLMYYIWADRDFTFQESKHHSFGELIRKVKHSTDEITRKVVLDLPQPIENLLSGEGGASEQILDLLSEALSNSRDWEQENS